MTKNMDMGELMDRVAAEGAIKCELLQQVTATAQKRLAELDKESEKRPLNRQAAEERLQWIAILLWVIAFQAQPLSPMSIPSGGGRRNR